MPARPIEIIFVLGEQEINRLEYDSEGRKLLTNQDVLIISIDEAKRKKLISNLKSRGLFRRGIVLAKSPYDDENYSEITDAAYEFAVEKYMYFSQLCSLLGAKEFTIQRLDTIINKKIYSFEGTGKLTSHQQELLAKDQQLSKLYSQIQIKDEFKGGEPNFGEAEIFIENKRLKGDPAINSLLSLRKQTDNPVLTRQLTLDLSNEFKRIIEITGKVRPPRFLSEIVASFSAVEKKSAEYKIILEIKF